MNPQASNTLEEMRRQMATLQEKLHNETIVNDRLLRESMKHSYSSINRYLVLESTILMPIIVFAFPFIALVFHLSWGPVIAIILLCLASVVFDYKVSHIKDEAFMTDDLIPTALRLQRAKRLSALQMLVSLPLTHFRRMGRTDWRLHRIGMRSDLCHPALSQATEDTPAGH